MTKQLDQIRIRLIQSLTYRRGTRFASWLIYQIWLAQIIE